MYEDDLQLGKLKENCLLLKLLSQTQKKGFFQKKVSDKGWHILLIRKVKSNILNILPV